MAEIKSTMELVREKLARMSKEELGQLDIDSDQLIKEGMRLGAAYMRGETDDLQGYLHNKPKAQKQHIIEGIIQSLLHNIVLPREKEQQQESEKAMQGLIDVGGENRELLHVFSEMKNVLNQYLTQRQEYRKQLTEVFLQQMHHLEQSVADQTGLSVKMDPAQHPKFQEEWQRIVVELNGQYGKAMDQYKNFVRQALKA